jgi:hypothetical protein
LDWQFLLLNPSIEHKVAEKAWICFEVALARDFLVE